MSEIRFSISRDRRGQYRWTLIAANHEQIAVRGKGFDDEAACRASIDRVRRHAPEAPIEDLTEADRNAGRRPGAVFELYRDARREYRWRLRAPDGQILAVASEGYKNKADCEHAIALVKGRSRADAPKAPRAVCLKPAPLVFPLWRREGNVVLVGEGFCSPHGLYYCWYGYYACS